MLSYAEHGKFRNPTQAPDPVPSFPAGTMRRETDEKALPAPEVIDFCKRSAA
jgi:hypothetical protein